MIRILLALLAILVSSASASGAQLRGVAVHPQTTDDSRSVIRREFGLLESAGADSVRFDVYWHTLQKNGPGAEDARTLSWLDWVIKQARRHHLKVILDVWSTPCWASAAPPNLRRGCSWGWWNRGVMSYPPRDPQQYADFAAFLAKRWGRSLAALEVWNEPNGVALPRFFSSSNPARDYAALVRATYPAVKAVAPHLPVIMSFAGTDTRFLSSLYGYGARGYYDGIAVHPYDQPTLSGLIAFHSLQSSEGDSAPLWVTEVGWSSLTYGLQGEATQLTSVSGQLAALPYVAAVEIYDMRDSGTDPSDPEDHFGLVDVDLKPKPAWYAFERTLRGLAPASSDQLSRRRRR